MKYIFAYLLTITVVISPSLASSAGGGLPAVRLLDSHEMGGSGLTKIVEDYAHPEVTAKLLDGHEFQKPNLTRVVQEYAPLEGPVCNLAVNEFLTMPFDVLMLIIKKLDKQLAFLSTCKRLHAIDNTRDLVLTLPHDFPRTQFWHMILQGKNPFRWSSCVKEVYLFLLPFDLDNTVDLFSDELVDSSAIFVDRLLSIFPNAEKLITRPFSGLGSSVDQKDRTKYGCFTCEHTVQHFCEAHYLNFRRVKLLRDLYGETYDDESHIVPQLQLGMNGLMWSGNKRVSQPKQLSILRFWPNPARSLLSIPLDGSLPAILDLYEQVYQSDLYKFQYYGGIKKPDDRVRLFLKALAQHPELWEFILFINKEISPIDRIYSYYTQRSIGVLMSHGHSSQLDSEYRAVIRLLDLWKSCLCEDSIAILKYISTQLKSISELTASNHWSDKPDKLDFLYTYLDTLQLVLQSKQHKPQARTLFRRLFEICSPEVYATCSKPLADALNNSEYLMNKIRAIYRHLSILSEEEFDEFITYLRTTERKVMSMDVVELGDMAQGFKSDRKLLTKG